MLVLHAVLSESNISSQLSTSMLSQWPPANWHIVKVFFQAVRLLQVSEAAWDLLSVMDEQAALANQKIDLFTNQERFPGVFEARANLTAADAALVRSSANVLSSNP